MATAIKMPQFGESVVEGTVERWLKQEGDRIEKLEALLEVSTDKIDSELPAPADGVLLRILVSAGQTVDAGTVLGYIGEPGEMELTSADAGPRRAESIPVWPDQVDGERQPASPSPRPQAPTSAAPAANARPTQKPGGRSFVSPVVARIAADHAIDVHSLQGTGLHGRVTKQDILAAVAQMPHARSEGRPAPLGIEGPSAPPAAWADDEELQPLTAMRRVIAQHMAQSVQTSPHVTTVFEVDMTRVVRHREQQRADFAAKGIQLTYTPYFVTAVAKALQAVPAVNSRFTAAGIVMRRRIHIGIAMSVPDGLLVPVIRDADEMNLQGLSRAVNGLAQRARRGELTPAELQGGTFTLTNHGTGGSILGTPIINQPQSGILGIGAITKRPVVISVERSLLPSAEDAIVIRPICYLSFSFDHRVLDGAQADSFLTTVKHALENWT